MNLFVPVSPKYRAGDDFLPFLSGSFFSSSRTGGLLQKNIDFYFQDPPSNGRPSNGKKAVLLRNLCSFFKLDISINLQK